MDYGHLLRRAWETIWAHKYLIVLGILVALLGSSGNASSNFRPGGTDFDFDFDGRMPRDFREFRDFDEWPEMPRFRGPAEGALPVLGGVLAIVGIAVVAVVGLVLWGIATTARGGLIAGVRDITAGQASSFGQAFGAGWAKLGHLLAIGVVPAIPTLLAVVAGLGATGLVAIASQALGGGFFGPGLAAILVPALCILIPIAVVLGTLRNFANRACMLEGESFLAAYRRGLDVLLANIGPAVVLAVIQIGINLAMGLVMIVPGIFMALCCVLWPVLLVIEGIKAAYFSTVWTLAWQEWTAAE